jgi:2'-5' RNA ligase
VNRLFLGLTPARLDENLELKQLLGKLKRTLSDQEKECKWVPPSNWHVTLVFLGSTSQEKTESAKNLLNGWSAPASSAIDLHFNGLGAFPLSEAAKILWLGVSAEQELLNTQASLESHFSAGGFDLGDEKTYRPHLTLVRFRNSLHVNELLKLGGRKSFGRYPVGEVVLYHSVLEGRFPKYIPIARKALAAVPNL